MKKNSRKTIKFEQDRDDKTNKKRTSSSSSLSSNQRPRSALVRKSTTNKNREKLSPLSSSGKNKSSNSSLVSKPGKKNNEMIRPKSAKMVRKSMIEPAVRIDPMTRISLNQRHCVVNIKKKKRINSRSRYDQIEKENENRWKVCSKIEWKERLNQGIQNLSRSEVLDWIDDSEIAIPFEMQRKVRKVPEEEKRRRRARYNTACKTLYEPLPTRKPKLFVNRSEMLRKQRQKRLRKAQRIKQPFKLRKKKEKRPAWKNV